MTKQLVFLVSGWMISLLVAPVLALSDSIGENGVNAHRLQQAP